MFGETWVEHQKLKKTAHLLLAAEVIFALLGLLLKSLLAAAEKQVLRFRRHGEHSFIYESS